MRERWVPLFERFGVDLVVSGHSHLYQRGTAPGHASTLQPVRWNSESREPVLPERRRILRRIRSAAAAGAGAGGGLLSRVKATTARAAAARAAATAHKVMYMITGGGGGGLEDTRVQDYGFYDVTVLDHHHVRLFVLPPPQVPPSAADVSSCVPGPRLAGFVYDLHDQLLDSFEIASATPGSLA